MQNVATTGGFHFRTQTDAWSLDQMRQVGVTSDIGATNESIAAWTARSLSTCFTGCFAGLTLSATETPALAGLTPGTLYVRTSGVGRTADVLFAVDRPGLARLTLYDVAGRRVARLLDETIAAGVRSVRIDQDDRAPGLYFLQLDAPGVRTTRRMLVLR